MQCESSIELKHQKEWTPEQYDAALRLVKRPLSKSPWLKMYCHALYLVSDDMDRRPDDSRRICDLGCGTGRFARMLFQSGYLAYTGIDFSHARVAMARQYNRAYDIQGPGFVTGNLLDPRVQDLFGGCHLFVALEVFEHIRDDLDLLRAIPAGSVVVASVPNYAGPGSGHVRRFDCLTDVILRYGGILDVTRSLVCPLNRKKQFYLFRGVTL